MKALARSIAFTAAIACAGVTSVAHADTSLGLQGVSSVSKAFATNVGSAETFWTTLQNMYSNLGASLAYSDIVGQFAAAAGGSFSNASANLNGIVNPGWSGSIAFVASSDKVTFTGIDGTRGGSVGGSLAAVPGPVAGAGLPAVVALLIGAFALRRREIMV